MERPLRHDAAMAAAILSLGILLLGLGVVLVERWRASAARNQDLMFTDVIGFAAAGAGILIVAWWFLSLVLAFISAICQKAGHAAGAKASGRLAPLFMRRLALAILGLNLLGAPLAHASTPEIDAAWSAPASSTAISAGWNPLQEPDKPARMAAQATTVLAALEGREVAHQAGAAALDPRWQPRRPPADPGLLGTKVTRAAQQADPSGAREVVVVRGDSLWSIAAKDLGAGASETDIAGHWPKWYAANKDVIGSDPGLIVPGQILQAPPKN
ncbi:hypothetical protein BIU82_01965 [Arthrobacter sp. SW1]|nr:hypothetical protein BIU82_01965 [Arthrobacter sp. SW1]